MKTSAIIPVKTFSNAKTRLNLPQQQREVVCKLMFEEVIKTISKCKLIDNESGVNHAIFLADEYISDNEYDCSIIFPQDIPVMKSIDIYNLLSFLKPDNSVIVVPSRQFNGTNALVRHPAKIMKPQYDMGSYRYQLDAARTETKNISVALIRRIMLDIDDKTDLELMLKQNEKPDFCNMIHNF